MLLIKTCPCRQKPVGWQTGRTAPRTRRSRMSPVSRRTLGAFLDSSLPGTLPCAMERSSAKSGKRVRAEPTVRRRCAFGQKLGVWHDVVLSAERGRLQVIMETSKEVFLLDNLQTLCLVYFSIYLFLSYLFQLFPSPPSFLLHTFISTPHVPLQITDQHSVLRTPIPCRPACFLGDGFTNGDQAFHGEGGEGGRIPGLWVWVCRRVMVEGGVTIPRRSINREQEAAGSVSSATLSLNLPASRGHGDNRPKPRSHDDQRACSFQSTAQRMSCWPTIRASLMVLPETLYLSTKTSPGRCLISAKHKPESWCFTVVSCKKKKKKKKKDADVKSKVFPVPLNQGTCVLTSSG